MGGGSSSSNSKLARLMAAAQDITGQRGEKGMVSSTHENREERMGGAARGSSARMNSRTTRVDTLPGPLTRWLLSRPLPLFALFHLKLNNTGLHHCFLNVVIQSLWHVRSFRERFIRLQHHQHQSNGLMHDYVAVQHKQPIASAPERQSSDGEDGTLITEAESEEARQAAFSASSASSASSPIPPIDASALADDRDSCVCCALKLIFINYEFSDASIIPPDTLRFALSLLLDNQGGNKFRMREMSDAEEAMDEILKYLHWDHVGMAAVPPAAAVGAAAKEESALSRSLDITCTPTCISHQVFGSQIMDQKICRDPRCGATSDPEMSVTFMYRAYVGELIRLKKMHSSWTLEELLRCSYLEQDYSCPSPEKSTKGPRGEKIVTKCAGPAKMERWCLNLPEVFALMCVWPQADETDRADIKAFFAIIPQTIQVDRFLKVQSAPANPNTYSFRFRGMILFYGRHYMAIFWSSAFKSYVMFDDKRVTNLGTWEQVVARCTLGKLQPTVILYESSDPAVELKLAKDIVAADRADEARVQREKAEAAAFKNATEANAPAIPASSPAPVATTSAPAATAAAVTAPAVPPRPAAAALADALSPHSANNAYFGSHASKGEAHIISMPSAPAAQTASSSTSAASSSPPAAFSDRPVVRQPPAVIPSYFSSLDDLGHSGGVGNSASSSDAKEDEEVREWERTLWQGQGQSTAGAGAAASNNSDLHSAPSNRAVAFGFASPSERYLHSAAAQRSTWICLGCSTHHPATVLHGRCPNCAHMPHTRSAHMQRIHMLAQKQAQQQAAALARTERR